MLAGNPFLADSLLIGEGGKRTISKIGPSFVYNTVDHPIFPTTGNALHAVDGLGGSRRQHELREPAGRRHLVHAARRQAPDVARASARRANTSSPTAARSTLPIFERLFLGGEYSMRGFDLRIGRPARPDDRARARRQQEPAVQRRVPDHHRRPGAAGALLRRRPGPRHRGENLRVEGSRSPSITYPGALHPGSERLLSDSGNPFLPPFPPELDARSARRARSRRRRAPKSGSSCRC